MAWLGPHRARGLRRLWGPVARVVLGRAWSARRLPPNRRARAPQSEVGDAGLGRGSGSGGGNPPAHGPVVGRCRRRLAPGENEQGWGRGVGLRPVGGTRVVRSGRTDTEAPNGVWGRAERRSRHADGASKRPNSTLSDGSGCRPEVGAVGLLTAVQLRSYRQTWPAWSRPCGRLARHQRRSRPRRSAGRPHAPIPAVGWPGPTGWIRPERARRWRGRRGSGPARRSRRWGLAPGSSSTPRPGRRQSQRSG